MSTWNNFYVLSLILTGLLVVLVIFLNYKPSKTPGPPTPLPPPRPPPGPPTPPAPINKAVKGVEFSHGGMPGDLTWMVQQDQYDDALFIFNDNQEQFLSTDPQEHCSAGGGNATLRPLQCVTPPRATGVPTGAAGSGYASLTATNKPIIEKALERAQFLIDKYQYRRVFYNSDSPNGEIGSHIFVIGQDVKDYITNGLRTLRTH